MNGTHILNALALSLLLGQTLHAQFVDDFSDGNLTSNPEWQGSPTDFTVEDGQLRLTAPEQDGTRSLYTSSQAIENADWRFTVFLDFNPSSNNYCDVHLVANGNSLENSDGYFVRIGDTEDEISLYRQDEGSAEKIIDGPDDVLDVSSVEAAIKVTRNGSGNWTLATDTDGPPYDYSQQGTATDDTYNASAFFGLRCIYTSTRSDKFYFDDFDVSGDPFTDTEPPAIESVSTTGEQNLEIVFSEPIEVTSAEAVTAYEVDGGLGNPVSVTLQADEQTAGLQFASPFESGTTYNLTVTGVTDLAGNTLDNGMASFTFYNLGNPEAGDVVFNEVMADPNPPVNLPEAEYTEVFNTSETYFNLAGFTFVNSSSGTPLPEYLLPPGEAVAICDSEDSTAIAQFGPVVGLPGFTALSNSGDSLTLLDSDDQMLDVLVYSDDWYDDGDKDDGGWSLERINPFSPCTNNQNWTAAAAPLGGSPGTGNSVFDPTPDETPPQALDAYATDVSTVIINVDEPLVEATLSSLDVQFQPAVTPGTLSISSNGEQLVLLLQDDLEIGQPYTLSISGLADCAGNQSQTQSLSIFLAQTPSQEQLLMSELMVDPTPAVSLPEAEYIELYNAADQTLDLSTCRLNALEFEQGTLIDSAQYLIACAPENAEALQEYGQVVALEELSATYLTNGGRKLTLTCGDNVVADELEYAEDWYRDAEKNDGGWSLERINLIEPCRGAGNWRASEAVAGGTPGHINSVNSTAPDQQPPNLVRVYPDSSGNLHLVFDEVLDSHSAESAVVMTQPELPIDSLGFDQDMPRQLVVVWQEVPTPDQGYELSISGVADCVGNMITAAVGASFGIPTPGQPGDVIINEVLPDPRTGGAEFVEVYNISNRVIDLQEWIIGDDPAEPPGVFPEVSADPYQLLPGQFAVFTDGPTNVHQEYPMGHQDRFLEVSSFPSLANSEGSIVLYNADNELIDRFDYTDDLHFELLENTDGVSLERISYSVPTQNSENWTSASEQAGFATPGYENSQHLAGQGSGDDFTLVSDVVSPDNDGYEDNLLIDYNLNQTSYVANITIYTQRGQPVRKLYRNYLLGDQGQLIWDGLTDDGEKAPVGVYAIFIEIFRPQGDVKDYILPCTVASRF